MNGKRRNQTFSLSSNVCYVFVGFICSKMFFSDNRLRLSKINDFCYSRRLLGCSGGTFGRSWGFPLPLLAALGPLLAALRPLLGRSWPLLGRSSPLLGCSWVALDRSWAALGGSWALLGRSWPLSRRQHRSSNVIFSTSEIFTRSL